MAYEIESVNGCTKKIKFNFEAVDLSEQIDVAIKKKQAESNLKGFRKGKAPIDMIKKMYGPQIENDALYQFVSQQYFQTIQEEGIKAVGYPQFGNTDYQSEQKKISFEATVETFPEFEVKDYKGLEFKKEDDSVSDEDFNNTLNQYLGSKAEMKEIEDKDKALENGLFAVMNFEGEKEDGEKPENMAGKEFLLEIGSNQFIPGFEEQMVGMKAGEKKTIEVTFPETYHEETLKGRPAKFHVELLEIKEKNLPELTDELAKEFQFESAEDMQTKIRTNLESQKKGQSREKLQADILNKLIELNTFDVPRALIEQQKEAIQKDITNNLKQQGFNDDMVKSYFEKWSDDLEEKGLFQVRSGLILDKLARDYEIESDESDLDKKLDELAAQSGMEKDQLANYYNGNETLKRNMLYVIREEKTFDRLFQDLKIK